MKVMKSLLHIESENDHYYPVFAADSHRRLEFRFCNLIPIVNPICVLVKCHMVAWWYYLPNAESEDTNGTRDYHLTDHGIAVSCEN